MGSSSIEWTDKTWNPTRGCSRVSQGCVNCYAEKFALRFSRPDMGPAEFTARKEGGDLPPFFGFVTKVNGHASWTGKVKLVESMLDAPLHWKKPYRVFVNSMSDLFHEALSDDDIDRVFAVMALCPQHTFQILTKRPERMLNYLSAQFRAGDVQVQANIRGDGAWLVGKDLPAQSTDRWPLPNVWLGVSVEDQATADERIPLLLQTPAAIRFVSYEPALGPVDFSAHSIPALWSGGLHWIIVGGESGPGARPFDIAWAESTVEQCKDANVACFVKQLGAKPFDGDGGPWLCRDKKGGDMDEWPIHLRVRDFPLVRTLDMGVR